jgi:hypothetical protein
MGDFMIETALHELSRKRRRPQIRRTSEREKASSPLPLPPAEEGEQTTCRRFKVPMHERLAVKAA